MKIALDVIILIVLILESIYIRTLEKDLDALKEWIQYFWNIDFGSMYDSVRKHRANERSRR